MATPTSKQSRYSLLGMSCISCSESAQSVLARLNGVEDVRVDFASNAVNITYNTQQTGYEQFAQSVKKLGYQLIADREAAHAAQLAYRSSLLNKFWLAFGVALVLMGLHHGLPLLGIPHPSWLPWLDLLLTLPVVLYSGRMFYTAAWQQAIKGHVSMDTLVAIGTGAAVLFSIINTFFPAFLSGSSQVYYESAAVILAFIVLGRYLEESAKQGTGQAIDQLMELAPQTATLLKPDGTTQLVSINDLQPGALVRVAPGERIPVDGRILQGESYIDESMLTGEPVPVHRGPQQNVVAGTLNQQSGLTIVVEQHGANTALAHIIHQVQAAQNSRARVQRLADRLAAWFVPFVLLLATATFIYWYWLSPLASLSIAFSNFLAVLIISCPCALGLATPVAVKVGVGQAAKLGLLVRNATALERAASIRTIVFDKTGTLTQGQPTVKAFTIAKVGDAYSGTWLPMLMGAAGQSAHPLSQAVARRLTEVNLQPLTPEAFTEEAGHGYHATFADGHLHVGSAAWLEQKGYNLPEDLKQPLDEARAAGHAIVAVGFREHIVAFMAVTDTLREDAHSVIQALHARGLRTIMLTGDHEQAAQYVAQQLGLSEAHAALKPADKQNYVQALQQEGPVAVVGDGINDAIALAGAELSIAMGSGSAIAQESAQVTLIGGRLASLPGLFALGRRTVAIIRQNLAWAFLYNIAAMPLAAGLFYPLQVHPALAGGAMAFSSLAVVLNSLRLKRNPKAT